jgi:hypothetical protein
VVKKKIESTVGRFSHNSNGSLTKVLGARYFSGEQSTVEMRFHARLSRAQPAIFPRQGQANGTTHSHYLSGRKFLGDHHDCPTSGFGFPTAVARGLPQREHQNSRRPLWFVDDSIREAGE